LYSRLVIAPFFLTAGLLGINAAIVLSFPTVTDSENNQSRSELKRLTTLRRELERVFRQPSVRSFVVYTVLLFGLVEVARTFIQPIVIGDQMGLSVVAVGGLYASFNIVAAGASAVTGGIERVVGIRRWFLISPFLLAGSFVLLPVVPAVAVLSFIGMEAIWQVSRTFQSGVINDRTGDHRRATVLSVVSMMGGIAAIASRAVGGVLADKYGPLVMLALLGLVFIVFSGGLLGTTPLLNFETTREDTSG
jgi:predicted MFS family arabinose efflux permease